MRYLALSEDDRKSMLDSLDISNIDDIFSKKLLNNLTKHDFDLPNHKTELEVERELTTLANKNLGSDESVFFLGAGCYRHHIPAAMDHLIQRGEFLTAYTPYQPEVSQGTLQSIFEFQSIITLLTGMDTANASMYDGSTAMAEALLMSKRINKKRNKFLISSNTNPMYLDVVETYTKRLSDTVEFITDEEILQNPEEHITEDLISYTIQIPNFRGEINDISKISAVCKERKVLLIVVITEILSLGMIPPPKEADIVVGEAQSIGVPMSFGGPHLGFFSCLKKHTRQLPGRLIGVTKDANNKRCFVLTLNAREQHIRRESATSNICSNQGLCALSFTIHMALLGNAGFVKLAQKNHNIAVKLLKKLQKIQGITVQNKSFFNEFVISINKNSYALVADAAQKNIIPGLAINDHELLIASTEINTESDIDSLCNYLTNYLSN